MTRKRTGIIVSFFVVAILAVMFALLNIFVFGKASFVWADEDDTSASETVTTISTAEELTSIESSSAFGTYQLTNDIEVDKYYTITQGLTLDLNGYTITGNVSSGNIGTSSSNGAAIIDITLSSKDDTVTIKDSSKGQTGMVENTGKTAVAISKGNLVVESGTYYANDNTGNGLYVAGGSCTICDGTFIGKAALYISGGTVTVCGGTFNGTSYGIYTSGSEIAYVTITDGTFTAPTAACLGNAYISITGGTFEGTNYGLYIGIYSSSYSDDFDNADGDIISVSGGTFSGSKSLYTGSSYAVNVSGGTWEGGIQKNGSAYPSISGGSFNSSVSSSYIASGSKSVSVDGAYYIMDSSSDTNPVVMIGNVGYASLDSALYAVKDEATLKLISTVVTTGVTVGGGTDSINVTLDLSGYSIISISGDTITVSANATLTVIGTGYIFNNVSGQVSIYNNGTVNLNGGILTRTGSASTSNVITNAGTLVIDGGTIQGKLNVTEDGGESTTIISGFFSAPELLKGNGIALYADYVDEDSLVYGPRVANSAGGYSVYGTLNSDSLYEIRKAEDFEVLITDSGGNTFGYKSISEALSNTYTTVGTYTVKLQADIEEDSEITIKSGYDVTLCFNGYTISCEAEAEKTEGASVINVIAGSLTLTDSEIAATALSAYSDFDYESAISSYRNAGGIHTNTEYAIYVSGSASVTVYGGSYVTTSESETTHKAYALYADSADSVIIKDGFFKGADAVYIHEGTSATVYDGLFISTADFMGYAFGSTAATTTISGGTYLSHTYALYIGTTDSTATIEGVYAVGEYGLDAAGGSITINGGTYIGTDKSSTYGAYISGANVTINGGDFSSDTYGLFITSNSNVTIKGGSVYGGDKAIDITSSGDTVTITGGDITGGNYSVYSNQVSSSMVSISDGTLDGSVYFADTDSISGGIFTSVYNAELSIPSGYGLVPNGDDTYSIVEGVLVSVNGTNYVSLEDAIAAITEEGTYTVAIYNNQTLSNKWVISSGYDITLELNGFAITNAGSNASLISVSAGGKLAINDSSKNGTGSITNDGAKAYRPIDVSGTLVINGGTYSGYLAMLVNAGADVTINGGTFSAVSGSKNSLIQCSGLLTINGGTFSTVGTAGLLILSGATLTISSISLTSESGCAINIQNGATVSIGTQGGSDEDVIIKSGASTPVIQIYKGAAVTIYSGTISVTGDTSASAAIGIFDNDDATLAAIITIYGGLITGGTYGISTNGQIDSNDDVTLTIEGGTITGEHTGMYLAGAGTYSISGSAVITGELTGVELRAGSLTISGDAAITGSTEKDDFSADPNSSGTTVTGAAVAVSQHTTNHETSLKVNGGTLTGYYAVYEADLQDSNTDGISMSLTGGTFVGLVSSENETGFISGGTYTEDVAEYVAEGYGMYADTEQENGSTLYVVVEADGNFAVVINGYGMEDFADALAYIESASNPTTSDEEDAETPQAVTKFTIVLYEDAYLSSTWTIADGISVTLDLNGKTITVADNADATDSSSFTENEFIDVKGTLIINDSSESGNGAILFDTSVTNSKAIRAEGSVIVNGGTISASNGIQIYCPNIVDGAAVTVNGGTIVGTNAAILSNGSHQGTATLTITGGTITNSRSTAIYLPSAGVATTISGGYISGAACGIEIRGGSIEITGGTIETTASALEDQENSSGSTVQGAALSISQYQDSKTYQVTVKISGGTFIAGSGCYAIYEVYEEGSSTTDKLESYKTSLTITGGTFEGDISSENCTQFISGGTFTTDVSKNEDNSNSSGYLASGFILTGSEGSYVVIEGNDQSTYVAYISTSAGYVGYVTLSAAINAAESGDVITLIADDTVSSALTISNSITLDLNGHTISTSSQVKILIIDSGAAVTIMDSSAAGTGAISSAATITSAIGVNDGGTLIINGGSYSGQLAIIISEGGEATINGGYFTTNSDSDGSVIQTAGKLTITGGTIVNTNDTGAGVYANKATADVTIGTEDGSDDDVYISAVGPAIDMLLGSCLTIYNGTISTTDDAIAILKNDDATEATRVYIYGGIITGGDTAITVSGEITTDDMVVINISGGIISATGTAMYLSGTGTYTISGGTISGAVGIEIRAGYLTISGGSISGATDKLELNQEVGNSGSNVISGAAIAIDEHVSDLAISVTITDGTIIGYYAVYEYNPQNNSDVEEKVSFSLEGGTYNGLIYSEDKKGFITGGTYDTDASEYVANGYALVDGQVTGAIRIGNDYFHSFEDALEAASEGDTLVLLADIVLTKTVTISIGITLDLNGYTISDGLTSDDEFGNIIGQGALEELFIIDAEGHDVTIKDSSTDGTGTLDNSGYHYDIVVNDVDTLTIEGGTYLAKTTPLRIVSCTACVIKDGTFEGSNGYAVELVDGNLTIYNGTFYVSSTYQDALYVEGGTFTIYDGTFESGNAIHVINGATGTVYGGTFTGSSYGLYCGPISDQIDGTVTIHGGTFTGGKYSLYSKGYDGFYVYGGTFDGDVYSQIVSDAYESSQLIYGGTFNSDTASSYLADGYVLYSADDGYEVIRAYNSAVVVNGIYGFDNLTDARSYISSATDVDSFTITLNADIETSSAFWIYEDVTLDLNGHSITSSTYAIVVSGTEAKATIIDSSAQNGAVISTESVQAVQVQSGASLAVSGGSYSGYYAIYVGSGSSMTIEDGSFTGSVVAINIYTGGEATINGGNFSTTDGSVYATVQNSGTLEINGGEFSGLTALNALSGSETTINGGEFTATGAANAAVQNSGTININDGSFVGGTAVYALSGSVTTINGGEFSVSTGSINATILTYGTLSIYGGTIGNSESAAVLTIMAGSTVIGTEGGSDKDVIISSTAGNAIALYTGASLTIYSGTITAATPASDDTAYAAILITATADGTEAANVTISGGTISGGTYGITVNGGITTEDLVNIKVTGGSISGTHTGMYLAGVGAYTISGGEISGPVGIEIRAGSLTISDDAAITGETTGTFTKSDSGTGALVDNGAALAIDQYSSNNGVTVTITGGELTGIYAVYEYDPTSTTDSTTLSISAGTFNGDFYSQNCTKFITGGTYTSISSEETFLTYLAYGYALVDGQVVGDIQVGSNYYTSLRDAIDATGTGDVITLLADIDLANEIAADGKEYVTIAKDVIINLNGYTITSSTYVFNVSGDDALLTIYDLSADQSGAVISTGSGSYHPIHVQSNGSVIINGGAYSGPLAIVAASGCSVTINGGSFTNENTAGYAVIQTSGTLLITGGKFTNSCGNAILAQSGSDVTITGGEFTATGAYAIIEESGNLVISDGTFSSTSSSVVHTKSGAEVAISGGEFTSADAQAVVIQDSSAVAITGGAFISTANAVVLIESGAEAIISGGSFSHGVDGGSTYAIVQSSGKLTITGGSFTSSTSGVMLLMDGSSTTIGGSDENTTISTSYSNAIEMYTGASLTVLSGTIKTTAVATENSAYAAIAVLASASGENAAELTVAGGSISGVSYGINVNGSIKNAGLVSIAITGGEITATNGTAIYFGGYGTYKISGGTISGLTGVEIRQGTLEISGGELTTSADFSNGSGSGSNISGAALAINTYNFSDLTVKISGGTFTATGENGCAVYEAYENGENVTYNVSLSISAGTFTGNVYSSDCTCFISGGSFTEEFDVSYYSDYALVEKSVIDEIQGTASVTYDGSEQTFGTEFETDETYSSLYSVITVSGTDAGTYTVYVIANQHVFFQLEDNTTVQNLTYTYTITQVTITNPSQDTATFTYGDEGIPEAFGSELKDNAETSRYEVYTVEATDAGTYTVYVVITDDNYTFMNDEEAVNVLTYTYTITQKSIDAPTASGKANTETITTTYTGESQTLGSDITADAGCGYTVYTVEATNAGTYTVYVVADSNHYFSIDDEGNEVDVLVFTYTISKAAVTLGKQQNSTVTYDGSEKTLGSELAGEDGCGYTVETVKATDAGTYTVYVIADSNHYFSIDDDGNEVDVLSFTYTISKAAVTLAEQQNAEVTYNGTEYEFGSEFTDTGYTVETVKATDAGTYTVYVIADSNHTFANDETSVAYTYTITAKEIEAPSQGTASVAYTGEEQTFGTDLSGDGYIVYEVTGSSVGTYTVYVVTDANHVFTDGSTSKAYTYTITKAEIEAPAQGAASVAYTGTEQTFGSELAGTGYTVNTVKGINAGTYIVTLVANEGYVFSDGNTALTYTYEITQASNSITGTITVTDGVPSGAEAAFGEVVYKIFSDDACENEVHTITVSGTYYVKAYVVETANYNGAESDAVEFTVTIRDASVEIPTAGTTSYAYTGEFQTLGSDITTNDAYEVHTVTAINVGTYTVYVIITDDTKAFTDGTTEKAFTYQITQAKNSVTLTVDEATGEYSATATFGQADIVYKIFSDETCENEVYTITESGTYYLKAYVTETANYKGAESDAVAFTVILREATVAIPELSATSFTYTGESMTLGSDIVENAAYKVYTVEATNVGTYTVYVIISDDTKAFTDGTTVQTFEYTITKAEIAAPTQSNASVAYTGEEQTFGTELSGDGYTVYEVTGSSVGTYTVYVVTDANHVFANGETSKAYTYTITAKEIEAPAQGTASVAYTGTEQTFGSELAGTGYTVNTVKGTNVGTYTVTVVAEDGHVFSDSSTALTYTYEITQAANSISGTITVTDGVPSGATALFGEVVYRFYSDEACTDEVFATTVSGTYYARAEVAETANYTGAVSAPVEFTIEVGVAERQEAVVSNSIGIASIGIILIAAVVVLVIIITSKKKK